MFINNNYMRKGSTFVKLDDIHNIDTFREKIKLEHDCGMDSYIKYNYFHDFWDELIIDTGFMSIESLHCLDPTKVKIRVSVDHKINKILTQVIDYVKSNLDDPKNKYLPINQSILNYQFCPRFYLKFCDQNLPDKSKCIFLGSKTKNFENTNIIDGNHLKKMYYSNTTECRLVIKPTIVCIQKNRCITMKIIKSEFKYRNSCVKSEFDKKINNTEIISDNVNLSYHINV